MRSDSTTIFLVRRGQTAPLELSAVDDRRADGHPPVIAPLTSQGVSDITRAARALSRATETIEAVYASDSSDATVGSARLMVKSVFPNLEVRQVMTEAVTAVSDNHDFFSNSKDAPDFILRFKKELDQHKIKTCVFVGSGDLIETILIDSGFVNRIDRYEVKHGSIFKCLVIPPLVSVTKILN